MDEGQADRDSIATVPDEALKRSEVGRLLETTYRNYVAGEHPKPAIRDPRLLCVLGKQFARSRQLDIAGQIANRLIKAQRKEPELAQLLSALCAGLSTAGSRQLARHYRTELQTRFPEAV